EHAKPAPAMAARRTLGKRYEKRIDIDRTVSGSERSQFRIARKSTCVVPQKSEQTAVKTSSNDRKRVSRIVLP
ncbi:MAG: hypothetical protein PHS86_06475, partial [Syntrophaceae bacterium]|nr:hypothetical protein [Syntrophaceae bacterium]